MSENILKLKKNNKLATNYSESTFLFISMIMIMMTLLADDISI